MAKRPTTHKGHEPGFCDWLCFPKRLKQEYAAKSGWDVSTPDRRQDVEERVVLWAREVKAAWQGRMIEDDLWAFWRARWKELASEGPQAQPSEKTSPRASREAWQGKLDHPREYR